LKAVTVQEGWVDYYDTAYDKVGNIQLTRIMGGDIRIDPAGFDIGIRDSWRRALDPVEEAGGRSYPIRPGYGDSESTATTSMSPDTPFRLTVLDSEVSYLTSTSAMVDVVTRISSLCASAATLAAM
jgi:1-aminocyclopropane-1-carboxylate deaminase/D-cysteine desulfhydrase-like pyridoxal-dependent ACC family enzyme